MIEEESNWFSKWEEQLPPPEDLMPISQSLITPDLALAFDIKPATPHNHYLREIHPQIHAPTSNHHMQQGIHLNPHNSSDFADSSELGGSGTPGSGPSDEPARTLKRPRLVWTPQLHKRFVDAVAHLGIKNAVPKTIMQLMSVDGLTRENVASHLQKYRLYLKRMQGFSSSGGGNGALGINGGGSVVDPATDHLFASGPMPPQFLPFVPVSAMHPHPHPQIGGSATAVHPQMQMHNYRQVAGGPFGSGIAANGQYDHHHHHFLGRQLQRSPRHRVGGGGNGGTGVGGIQPFVEDLESADGSSGGNRKILTLFPTGDD
ncbi:hypothetical protein MLD38_015915 [Melastoma candidum]|uniref:Uncharacterized protein n=1 Tax=Melastoma candidum TaxID=119954 RepID=A0ACB9RHH8_9MYRT|nr:hypothetical protein MLD38_015915 [Melastoma candidum]